MSKYRILAKSRTRNRRATQVVEFALVLPFLLGVVFSSIDMAWWFTSQHILDICVQEGAFAGALEAQTGDPNQAAEDFATTRWAGFPLGGTPSFTASRSGTPETLTLIGTMPFEPLIGMWFNSSTVDVTVTQYMEDQP
jgi:Flp pilus assembly protein TadG